MNKSSVKIFLLLLTGVITYFFFLHLKTLSFIQDDAFIYLRYVKNFLAGRGLVFNGGEFVEGYTGFLWLLLLIIGTLLGANPVWLIRALSSAFGLAVILGLIPLTRCFLENQFRKNESIAKLLLLLPSFGVAFTAGFIYWSTSGMETSLFAFLFIATFYFKLKASKAFVFTAILLALARPEGTFVVLILMLSDLLFVKFNGGKNLPEFFLKELLMFVLPVLIYFLFRLYYYGEIFPNTFYAKTGSEYFYLKRGMKYFLDFWGNTYSFALFALPFLYAAVKYYRKYYVFLSVNIIVTYSIYVILIGGDVLPSIRFFIPILPLLFLILSLAIRDFSFYLTERLKPGAKNILLLLTFVSVIAAIVNNFNINNNLLLKWRAYERGLVFKMKLYANWVNEVREINGKPLTVALSTIGAFSYYSNSRVLDIIGLTDSYIAHHPEEVKGIAGRITVKWKERHYNVNYVLSRKPDYVIFPAGAKPASYPEVALFASPVFRKNYYLTLFYSSKFYQLLPVFKLIPDSLKTSRNSVQTSCDIQFVEDYLLATNHFLSFLKNKNTPETDSVKKYCKLLVEHCPSEKYLALNVLGYSAYHYGNIDAALGYFQKSVKLNGLNTIALVYLINIYRKKEMEKKLNETVLKLKRIAPFVYPNLIIKR